MKILESSPITFALPSNSRMAEDLAPLYDALDVSPKQGGQTRTPRLPNTIIRFTRGQDIIQNLIDPSGTFNFGIAGEDTALEALTETTPPFTTRSDMLDAVVEFPELGQRTALSKLIRCGDLEAILPETLWRRKTPLIILTSYPNLTRAAAYTMPNAQNIRVKQIAGGVEKALSCGDYGPDALMAVDIVRTGKTIKDEGLICVGAPLCVSSPTLFTVSRTGVERARQRDFEDQLIECAQSASIPMSMPRPYKTTADEKFLDTLRGRAFEYKIAPKSANTPARERLIGLINEVRGIVPTETLAPLLIQIQSTLREAAKLDQKELAALMKDADNRYISAR